MADGKPISLWFTIYDLRFDAPNPARSEIEPYQESKKKGFQFAIFETTEIAENSKIVFLSGLFVLFVFKPAVFSY